MDFNGRTNPHIERAASMALRRTAAAFGLDPTRLTLSLEVVGANRLKILLECRVDGAGDPFLQRRHHSLQDRSHAWRAADVRAAVEAMMMNVALACRPTHPQPPTGWSIHPVAASVIAAANTELPNPADPFNWLEWDSGEIHLPNGGHIVDAVFSGRSGVLLLQRAKIVDRHGATVATLGMDGSSLVVRLPGAYPETYAVALKGKPAETVCNLFAADPRGASLPVSSATCSLSDPPALHVQLVDRLVPLLPTAAGGERWRPARAKGIADPRFPAHLLRYLQHSTSALKRYYARASPTASTSRKARTIVVPLASAAPPTGVR